jgi:poly(A) polymerase
MAEELARRFKLSNDEIDILKMMVLWHLRPGYLGEFKEPSMRAKFRYFRDTAREAVSVLLLSLADQRATCGPLTTRQARRQHEKVCFALIKEYFQKLKEKKPQRLITGDDLLRMFKLQPSPLIGKILSRIEEAQGIGRLKNKPQAYALARKIIKQQETSEKVFFH